MTKARNVAEFYEGYNEGDRLFDRPQGRLERARIQSLITRFMPPPPARVLDVGGAEGVHSEWMATRGWEVELFDLTPKHVEAASSVGTFKAELADARELPRDNEYADGVALLGPLYHLCAREDRMAALRESRRVLRPGGTLLAAAISRYRFMYEPHPLRDGAARLEFLKQIQSNEGRVVFGDGAEFNAFYHLPHELKGEVEEAGFCDVRVLAVEGFGWPAGCEPTAENLQALEILEETDAALGSTWHFVAAGRRP